MRRPTQEELDRWHNQTEKPLMEKLAKTYAEMASNPAWSEYVRDRMKTMRWPEVRQMALEKYDELKKQGTQGPAAS